MALLLIKVLTFIALRPEWAPQCFIVTLTILNTPKRYESIGLITKLSDYDVEKTTEIGSYVLSPFRNCKYIVKVFANSMNSELLF